MGVFWKCARIGERLSPYISICCVGMAVSQKHKNQHTLSLLDGPCDVSDLAPAVFDGIGAQGCTRRSDDWRHDIAPLFERHTRSGASRRLLGFRKGTMRSDSLVMARRPPGSTSILDATEDFFLRGAPDENITATG